MNTTTHDELVARVVAWHNRHPLARRITPAHVQGLGVVALPFVEAAGSLAQRDAWQAVFSEDFIAPLAPAKVAQFARLHGQTEPLDAQDLPRRDVLVDIRLARAGAGVGSAALQLCVWSAAIEVDSRRGRVLLSVAVPGHIIGPRVWSKARARVAGLAAGLIGLSIIGALGFAPQNPPKPEVVAHAMPAAMPAAPPPPPPQLPLPTATAPPPITTPLQPWPVNIRPVLATEVARAAKQEAASLRDLAPKVLPAPTRTYALAARSTKSRAASELLLSFIKGAGASESGQRTEVLPARHGWRATLWPFTTAHDAEQARELLASRGVSVDVVDF